jgi:hypothetical protein
LAAIAIPALTGYISKGDQTKITSDARTATEAIQAWAILQYAKGVIGNDALLGTVESTAGFDGVSEATATSYTYQKYVELDVTAVSPQDVTLTVLVWLGTANPGLYARVWLGGVPVTGAVDVGSVAGGNPKFTLASGVTLPKDTPELLVVFGDDSIGAMSYETAKKHGAILIPGNVNGATTDSSWSWLIKTTDTKALHYDASQVTPGSTQWKPIVDELASTAWTPDDTIEISNVTFDTANKVQTMTIKVGDQTCTYANGAYTVS